MTDVTGGSPLLLWLGGLLAGLLLLVLLLAALVRWAVSGAVSGVVSGALARAAADQAAATEQALRTQLEALARQTRSDAQQAQALVQQTLALMQQTLLHQAGDTARTQNEQIDTFRTQLTATQQALQLGLQGATQGLARQAEATREAQDAALRRFAEAQAQQLSGLREAVEQRLAQLQDGNEKKLEQMRLTVDEKLQITLETRLGESFRQVAERLEQVQQGLGEMRGLARDVGSLSRVLTNVKSRGLFGEVQLAALLEQVFTPDQYAANVETVPGSNARVEFALRLPGQRGDGQPLWLPIDAKFPREDYERLLDAQERADREATEAAAKALELRLRAEARSIHEKYVAPPHTTDFAILFVPTEGLYAEALRRPGLVESLQREWRVSLAGPTTLHAMLSSLQMGFRTLALEKRSAEVWDVLGAVKTEFGKFGDQLAKARKKLDEAANTIDQTSVRTRAMARRLKGVEAMPEAGVAALLGADDSAGAAAEEPPGASDDGAGSVPA